MPIDDERYDIDKAYRQGVDDQRQAQREFEQATLRHVREVLIPKVAKELEEMQAEHMKIWEDFILRHTPKE